MLELEVNSVRFRLTLWYVGFLCLVLIGFSVGVYTLLERSSSATLDRELASSIDVLGRSLRHEIEEHEGNPMGEDSFREVVSTVYRDAFPGFAIATYEHGRLVAAKPGPFGMIPELSGNITPEVAFEDISGEYLGESSDAEEPWRRATMRLIVPGAGDYEFVSCASLVPMENELARLRGIFMLSIPMALLVAAVGGFLLARRSLSPVVAMSDTAAQISSKDLSQRIPTGNPKDELGRLATTFNQLLGRLEDSFTLQRQFMADSSHELRTPLYVAHTAAQVILDREQRPEEEYREALAIIDEQMNRLNRIVEDMLVLARADAGVYPLAISEFYLDETIAECFRAAKLLGVRRGVKVSSPNLDELPCRGDEGLIRQMVMILLDNAIKYTPAGGNVRVEVQQAYNSGAQSYQIDVIDTGPGIPAEAQPHVFERFFRVDKARGNDGAPESGGAGLGLAIAKWIAEVHGGRLTLLETSENGTVFRATLVCMPDESVG